MHFVASSMVWSVKFIKYRENKLIDTTYVQNVHLWLKYKLASVLVIGQLYYQSANAPRCTTQLRDVCGLPLPVRNQVNQFRAPFLTNFLFLFVSISYQNIPESVAEHRSLLMCLLQYQFTRLPAIYLSLHDNDVMFTLWIKKVNSLFSESIYFCFQTCKSY